MRRLDDAQRQKIRKIVKFAGISNETRSIVDLGCGWGKTLDYINRCYPNSREQYSYCQSLFQHKSVKVLFSDLIEYLDKLPEQSVDAAIMIGVIEHIASQKQYKCNEHIRAYRKVFESAHRVVSGKFALQTIVAMRSANALRGRERQRAIRFQYFIAKYIFPNSLTPRDDYIRQAIDGLYTVEKFEVGSDEYFKTITIWRENLERYRVEIPVQRYELFAHYFDMCMEHFESGYIGLARYEL